MRHGVLFSLGSVALAFELAAQSAVDVARPEERQKARQAIVKEQEKRAKQTSIIEFRGEQAFSEKELRVALKEEITTIDQFGLSPARADDLAFFLEVFYRKHGYAKVDVHYVIESVIDCVSILRKVRDSCCELSCSKEMQKNQRTSSLNIWWGQRGSDIRGWRKDCHSLGQTWRRGRNWCTAFTLQKGSWTLWWIRRATNFRSKVVRLTSSFRFMRADNIFLAPLDLTVALFTGQKRFAGRWLICYSAHIPTRA